MKVKLLFLLSVFLIPSQNWYHNLNDAEKIAEKEHRYILLNFSGSDWCGPCIRMRSEIFESNVFKQMADAELVMVNADFPRNKKNQLPAEQQKLNDEMADKYNSHGKFPYTLLLNAEGKVLQTWEGLPDESPENFTMEVRNAMYTNQ
jgi:thioredoxin-related protein